MLACLVLPVEDRESLTDPEVRGLEYLLVDALSDHARRTGSSLTALRSAVTAAVHLESLIDELGAAEAVRLVGDLRHSPAGERVIAAAEYVSGVSSRIHAA